MMEYLNTSKFLPLKTLDQMYKALVRLHLNYCDILYHKPLYTNQSPSGVSLNSQIEKFEKIQYHAALVISGAWRGSSRSKLYEELGNYGKLFLIVVSVDVYYRVTRFLIARLLPT